MVASKEALEKLLGDDDPRTVQMVKDQLVALADELPPILEELAQADDESVSAHAREILAGARGRQAVEDFSLLCHLGGDSMDIEQAGWALSRAIRPGVDTTPFEETVNEWGREFLSRIPCADSNSARVSLLSDFLSGELGIKGNAERYYCEDNSLLPGIISSRAGIPISLTLLYIMVGSRAAMKIEGINLPGHFIARHGEVLFDPFHEGRILSECDVRRILEKQGLELRDSHLQPASGRQFLLRMLANLLYVYDLDGNNALHQRVKSWMSAIACGAALK